MGITGPIPARSDQRARRNKPDVPIDKVTAIGSVEVPDLNMPDAHPLVPALYEAMKNSAQRKFMEPTDWAYAQVAFVFLDGLLKDPGRRGASMMVASVDSMLSKLLLTEGDRRRVRMEVERSSQEGGEVVAIADLFRQRLQQG